MMAMISPALEAMVESLSTLKFANRAKNIRNEARVNEDLDQKSLLRKYERELKKLRAELDARSKNVVDKRRLLELDEQRKRAEADKMMAIKALEARSVEFMREKEEKKRLEQRIAMLMGQMIKGDKNSVQDLGLDVALETAVAQQQALGQGSDGEQGGPAFHVMMKEQQEKLRQEYDGKLAEIERERESIEEEKAQVDRYKQLLLKQRDIMIALTQRLVERDEQIMALQDELDAYDRHHKELEEKLDEKTALLIKFQRISLEMNTSSPNKNEELSAALESWNTMAEQHDGGATEVVEMGSLSAQNSQEGLSKMGGGGEDKAVISLQKERIAELQEQVNRLSADSESKGTRNESAHRVTSEESTADAIQAVEEAFSAELEVHLSRLEGDGNIRQGLRQPISGLLRQVLERVRQSKGEVKIEEMVANLQRVTEERNSYETRVREMEAELTKSREMLAGTGAASGTPDSATMAARCDHLVKEREAVQTIMEQKIKVLVQSIAASSSGFINGQASLHGQAASNNPAAQALTKDVAALQRLVNASIAALRNAASNT
jgi:hypothetical protein